MYLFAFFHLARTNQTQLGAYSAGDVIGYVGSTGNSSGPHLHVEAYYLGPAGTYEEYMAIEHTIS